MENNFGECYKFVWINLIIFWKEEVNVTSQLVFLFKSLYGDNRYISKHESSGDREIFVYWKNDYLPFHVVSRK